MTHSLTNVSSYIQFHFWTDRDTINHFTYLWITQQKYVENLTVWKKFRIQGQSFDTNAAFFIYFLVNSQTILCFTTIETHVKRSQTENDLDECNMLTGSLKSSRWLHFILLWALYVWGCLLCAQCVGCFSVHSSWFINLQAAVGLLSRLWGSVRDGELMRNWNKYLQNFDSQVKKSCSC